MQELLDYLAPIPAGPMAENEEDTGHANMEKE